MFRAKRQYFKLPRSRLGFCEETDLREEKEKSNFLFRSAFFSFLALSFRGQNLLKARPDWSPLGVAKSLSHARMVSFNLGVKFKISYEHPRLFHIEVPAPGTQTGYVT